MSEVVAIETRERSACDAQNDLETKLWDLEAITDLMINVHGSHMEGSDVSKFGGMLWRIVLEAQKSFDEMCKLQVEERKGGAK